MNFHALAPKRYKQSVVAGFVHRIYRSCSTWKNFHESLKKAKQILEKNQYPPLFYDPIIEKTISKLLMTEPEEQKQRKEKKEFIEKRIIFIQYRGKLSEEYERSLKRCHAPCNVIMTLRKMKTVLPSL